MPTSLFDILTQKKPSQTSLSEEGRKNPIVVGVACTLLFHVLLVLVAPLLPVDRLTGTHSNLDAINARKDKSFDFELEPLPVASQQPDPSVNMDTNPDAPSNEPDKTTVFSNRNQQAAQAKAAEEIDPLGRPSIDGDANILYSKAIQTGSGEIEQEAAAATPQSIVTHGDAIEQQELIKAQTPFTGTESMSGDSDEGVSTSNAQEVRPDANSSQLVSGSTSSTEVSGATEIKIQASKIMPKPRPRISQHRSEVLSIRSAGVKRKGLIASTAFMTDFGEYLDEFWGIMYAELDNLWEMNALHYNLRPGTTVTVTFTLNSQGEVSIKSIEQTTGLLVALLVQTAISNPQPYRKWTEKMKTTLGSQQTLSFTLYLN